MNWKRLINWFTFGVCFALLPLLFAWIFRALAGKDSLEANSDFPEILFFSVMVCSTTISDIRGANKQQSWSNYFLALESILTLGAIVSAGLYGGIRFASILNPSIAFRMQLLTYSILLTIALFLCSTASQIMISTVEGTLVKGTQVGGGT